MIKIKRINKKSRVILLGSLLISIGIIIPLSKYFYHHYLDNKNDDMIEVFFEDKDVITEITSTQENVDKKESKNIQIDYNYIAVLEIPSISLKRGLVDKSSTYNTISRNIQILNESDMPNVVNGNLILASHSGSSYVSFFKNLDKINEEDYVYIYYNNIKYIYKVVSIYEETKDGDITIHRSNDKTTLTMTTCSQSNKDNQLIVISELVDKENY